MAEPGTILTLVVAGLASAFMAWSIGAGSSGSTPFAPAVGANAISVMRAGFVVGLLGLAGAVLQGANVTNAVGRQLIHGVTISQVAATVGLLVAAGLVSIGVFAGYPIATAFTVTGAMIGVGLGLGGDPAWAKYREIGALWVLTPVVGGGMAYAIARWLDRDGAPRYAIPILGALVGVLLANIEFVLLGPGDEQLSVATAVGRWLAPTVPGDGMAGWRLAVSALVAFAVLAWLWRAMDTRPAAGQRRFLLALGGLVAFSAGGSQVGLAIGPLVPFLGSVAADIPIEAVLLGGGLGLLAGSWTGAPRMIKAISQDYSSLGPNRSIAALVPSFAIAQIAVFYGIPVSFNEIVVSAIIGSGYAAGGGHVSGRKMGYTVAAWAGSFAIAFGLSFGLYRVLVSLGLS